MNIDLSHLLKKFLLENEKAIEFGYHLIKIIIIFIVAKIVIKVIDKAVEKLFEKQRKIGIVGSEAKRKTLTELCKSITRYVVYFIAIIWMLDIFGVSMKTILAVTGAASVAIGLGAQSLIKDVISGFFILFEDQFAVGDYIIVNNLSGFVESIGIRITTLRDYSGDVNIIPNGTIQCVTNKSRGNTRALVDIQVGYTEDPDHILDIINEVLAGIKKDCDYIVDGPSVLGIVNITEYLMTIRIVAKTKPLMQMDLEMEIRRRVKMKFDEEGITMPYQKMVVMNNGQEPGANVQEGTNYQNKKSTEMVDEVETKK